jgi:hypothetical protein
MEGVSVSRSIDEATPAELIRERRRELRSRIEGLKAKNAKTAAALVLARRDAIAAPLEHADATITLADASRALAAIR